MRKRWYKHHVLSEIDKLPFVLIAWLDIEDISRLGEIEQMYIDYYQPILNKHGRRKYTKCEVKLPLENHQRLKKAISHMKIDKNELINDLIVDFLNAKGY